MARARARRRRSRFTPRRWLPFVALSALVAGATVIEADTDPVDPTELDASLDVRTLATVAREDAISSAWFCGGGTASGEDGIAELALVLANDAPEGATAEVTFVTGDEASEPQVLEVPAYGRARLAASEVVEGEWVAALVEVRGGRVAVDREVSGPLGFDASPCSTEASDRWYVPSGSTVRGATEHLSFFNPFPDPVSIDVAFATDTGARSPRALRSFSVPGRSVRVVDIGELVTDRTEVAAVVRVRVGRVVVDRIQTFDGSGDEVTTTDDADEEITTPAPRGLVSTAASPVRAERWVIPGARVAEGVRTQIHVYNPSSADAEVDVVLGYQDPERLPELLPVELTVRAQEQVVVDLNSITGIVLDTDLWVDVRSLDGVPIVAERVTSFGEPAPRQGVAATLGSPVSATRWLVTQGGSTRLRSGTVQVANPGAATARITVRHLVDGDAVELPSAAIELAPGDRRSLDLSDAGAAASIVVESTEAVVVGSSLSLGSGTGVSLQPAFPFPEAVVPLPPLR
jgi:hypothetical protein